MPEKRITYFFFVLLLFLSSNGIQAQYQKDYTKYWIGFKDKPNTENLQSYPELFLSERAIQRRQKFNIPIVYNDLPVSVSYLQKLRETGAKILYKSKWLNGAVVLAEKSAILEKINTFPFVNKIEAVGKNRRKRKTTTIISTKSIPVEVKITETKQPKEGIYYGEAFHQIQMLKGDYLHAKGFTGRGMIVAVTDAGFSAVHRMKVFQHIYEENRLAGIFDFVDVDTNPYHDSTHGTHVLSTIAAKIPGEFVGTAPDASFWLFRTEDNKSETRIEEYNWVAAAEMADSAGVDVINVSLGYSTFDDSQMSYTIDDLDGNTSVITRGADIAASKGMLLVVSAGNKGNKKWKYVTMPADADSVLTVGAVDPRQRYAIFSSKGLDTPNAITKPNLVTQGQAAKTITTDGSIYKANGTSFAAPIMAGIATCLWQAYPEKHPQTIIQSLQKNASDAENPSNLFGYGIPNLQASHTELSTTPSPPMTHNIETARAFVYPNPSDDIAQIYYYSPRQEHLQIQIFDLIGKLHHTYQLTVRAQEAYKFDFIDWQFVSKGMYLVQIENGEGKTFLKAVNTVD